MKYDSFRQLFLDKWIELLALAVSVFALYFSVQSYRDHQHQLLEDKQIDAVVGLVEYIQECNLAILFTPQSDNKVYKEFQVYTFFELADTTIRSDMDSSPIFFPSKERLPIDFTSYINNPLIPSEIATKLRDYYLLDVQYKSCYDATVKANVFITRFEKPESMRLNNMDFKNNLEKEYGLDTIQPGFWDQFISMRHVPALRNFGQLKKNNKELYNLIVKWFHEKGMDNVNIPMDSRLYEKRRYIR